MRNLRYGRTLGITAGVIALAVTLAWGLGVAQAKRAVEIGDTMPDFQLKDPNGTAHKLSDNKGKVVVLVFRSQNCPWSRGAAPGINALAKKYKDKDVVFFGIDSDYKTTPADIKAYTEKNSYTFTVLKDQDNRYADKVEAKQTPEFFVVNQEGKLAYHGAFDNRRAPAKAGDVNYVANAVDSLLAGKPVAKTEVRAFGCSIMRAPRAGS